MTLRQTLTTIALSLAFAAGDVMYAGAQVDKVMENTGNKTFRVIDGQLREVVVEMSADSTGTVEVVVADTAVVERDSVETLSKRRQRRLERALQDADSTFVRHSKLFRDSIPISNLCLRSALIPGYAQLYNRQYWKVPVLYAAVGTTLALGLGQNGKYSYYKKQYDALQRDGAPYSQIEPVQSNMIKRNTYRQALLGTALATYIYFIGDGAVNYPGDLSSVKKATTLSTICPGAGQMYNGSYWKVPVVVGGFATLGYIIDFNNRGYNRFKLAYDLVMDGNDDTVDEFNGRYSGDFLKNLRNSYRRNRDLAIIMTGAFYLLNVVDAHVDAHLKDYDVSDDLTWNIEPSMQDFYSHRTGNAYTYGLSLKINF